MVASLDGPWSIDDCRRLFRRSVWSIRSRCAALDFFRGSCTDREAAAAAAAYVASSCSNSCMSRRPRTIFEMRNMATQVMDGRLSNINTSSA